MLSIAHSHFLFFLKVERRENEIERLAGQLRGGRPPEALAMEGKIETNERMTAHLNIQVKREREREREVMWHTYMYMYH